MQKNWIPIPTPEVTITDQLSEALNIGPVISKLLAQRGIRTFEEARAFFRPDLEELHDPFLMRDMDRAVRRLEEALENGEKILVYGDYDVDGTTAVTIMYSFLHDLGVACDYYIRTDIPKAMDSR